MIFDKQKAWQLEVQARQRNHKIPRVLHLAAAEAYSPPRLTKIANDYGLNPFWVLDLTKHDPEYCHP